MSTHYTKPQIHKHLDSLASPHLVSGRTKSAAMLAWFLNTIMRLDDIEADDAVCDGDSDKGFDGLFVNDERSEIVALQSKRANRFGRELGDVDLKGFVGSLAQLATRESSQILLETTTNPDLERILETEAVAEKIAQGYSIYPIFVTNRSLNPVGRDYLETDLTGAWEHIQEIDVWDAVKLDAVIHQLKEKVWSVKEKTKLKISKSGRFIVGDTRSPSLVLAAIPATELVKLPGISDYRIFSRNVRLGLGNTRVNLELAQSVKTADDHQHFLKFHNGLTIVAESLRVWGDYVHLSDYSVCNGCQSLLTFYNNSESLTQELEVLVRFVGLSDESDLSQEIAYRTNNQNPINLRDLESNDSTQIVLQKQFNEAYGHESYYRIKRGEVCTVPPLENEEAGRLLLSVFLKMPWSSHQKYRVFDDLKSKIFSYNTDAHHIRLAQMIDGVVRRHLVDIKLERVGKYAMTRYIVGFMVSEVLRTSEDGRSLLEKPSDYSDELKLFASGGSIADQLEEIAKACVIELNYFIEDNGGEAYDYKRLFKSEKGVMAIANESTKNHELLRARDAATEFTLA